ncbi:MAG: TIGR00730 family Rossman fold protein [Spirochaetales bacterium]|nr:TIGR00730 family Rossman fold protein [Spirochaetales bacterium]
MNRSITVFASSSGHLDQQYYTSARTTGKILAEQGFHIVYGGGNNGLMGAMAESAWSHGGKLSGVITRPLRERGYCFEQADEIIETETLDERKKIMEDKAEAFVVLPGGVGTLDELFSVLSKKQLGYHDKPVFCIECNGYFTALHDFFSILIKNNFTSADDTSLFTIIKNAESLEVVLAQL